MKNIIPVTAFLMFIQMLVIIFLLNMLQTSLFKKIEEASLAKDLKTKAELKSKLYYIVPTVFCDGKGRSYENIVNFTGITTLDFDNIFFKCFGYQSTFIFVRR